MPTAVLDACVLYRGLLTDLLLWIAYEGVFTPIWSEDIHNEWCRNLANRLPEDAIQYRRTEMEKAFKTANVPADNAITATISEMCRTAAQRKDAHVVATAVAAKASVIVTTNIKDFGRNVLDAYNLEKMQPDRFLSLLLATARNEVLAGVKAHRKSLKRTNLTVDKYLIELTGSKAELHQFTRSLENHRDAI